MNAGLSYPYVDIRRGKSTKGWDSNGAPSYDTHQFDGNESWSTTVADHTITFNRGSDDDDNKHWTVTLQ